MSRRNSDGIELPEAPPDDRSYDERNLSARPAFWTSDEWATPPAVVAEWAREVGGFDLDVCCRAETAKAPQFYTKADDGLSQRWFGRVWCNPPFSDPSPWLRKAIAERNHCEVIVMLLPASTDTRWFHNYVLPLASEIRFRQGRIKFHGWQGTPIGSPKGGTVFAVYRPVEDR